jgi:hypothetical protein
MQLFSVLFFAFFIPVSALIADRINVENAYLCHNGHFLVFSFFFLNSGSPVLVTLFLCIGMALMGFTMVLWELSCRNCFLRTFVIGNFFGI